MLTARATGRASLPETESARITGLVSNRRAPDHLAGGRGAERPPGSLLSRPIQHFEVGDEALLGALVRLGREYRLCFGIEFPGADLGPRARVKADRATAEEVMRRILGSTTEYNVSASDGVILIRKKGVKPLAWLNHRLPQFEIPRMSLMWAQTRLWMELERHLNPSDGGFAGDGPPGDPNDLVGPIHERGKTVRQLLNEIVSESKGAMLVRNNRRRSSIASDAHQPFWDIRRVQ